MAKYALLIGVSNYQHHDAIAASPTALSDVKAMEKILTHPDMGGFAEVMPVFDPDRMAMEEAIEEFFRKCHPQDLAVLFYSGRGVQDEVGRPYFTTHSTRTTAEGQLVRSTAVPASSVQALIGGRSSQQQVIILDCGFSHNQDSSQVPTAQFHQPNGNLTQDGNGIHRGDRLTPSNGTHQIVPSMPNPVVPLPQLAASSGGAQPISSGSASSESVAQDYGFVTTLKQQLGLQGRVILLGEGSLSTATNSDLSPYTHYLIEGITSGAADQNGDAEVSVRELHDYARRHVQAEIPTAHPELIAVRDEDCEINLARVPLIDPGRRYREQVEHYMSDGRISPVARVILDRQRVKLDLPTAQALSIENEVLRPYREHADNLLRYRKALTAALELSYPLSQTLVDELKDLQALLELTDAELEPIQQAVMRPYVEQAETHQQHVQQYTAAFREAIAQSYPVSNTVRQTLAALQRSLQLTDPDVADIEARLIAADQQRREQYRANLRQLEKEWLAEVQTQYPPAPETLLQFEKRQHSLGIQPTDAEAIRQAVFREIEAQHAQYRRKLEQYRTGFLEAIAHSPILDKPTRDHLHQLQANLELNDNDIIQIEQQAIAQRDTVHRKHANLERYRQEYARSIQEEYPLSEASQQNLKRIQENLQLSDEDVLPIQRQLAAQAEAQRQHSHKRLDHYQHEFAAAIAKEFPLSDATRQRLDQAWQAAGLKEQDVRQIEYVLEGEVKAEREQYTIRLHEFERAYSEAARTHYPLPIQERDRIIALAQTLEIKSEDVMQIEANTALAYEAPVNPPTPPAEPEAATTPDAPSAESAPAPESSTEASRSDDLVSTVNVDYSILRDLLQEGRWREADSETLRVMLQATRREQEDWLSPESLLALPCVDLHTIDKLWSSHSNGYFGFSAQARIYNTLNASLRGNKRAVEFALLVKWMFKLGGVYPMFREYKQLDFHLPNQIGHLPALWYWRLSSMGSFMAGAGISGDRSYGGADMNMLANLMQRLKDCGL
ncbi:GUN4 domain-containing protein [Leptolyngbya sp. AN02str]|uniref:GUN4 domain-containing protein n=1 Tax=Leptolyngbya sp. AN02str TaxID=3423363 RepID=UPI003D31C995